MTKRVEQVASALHRGVADILRQGLSDPRVTGLISVTRVDVSPDLKNAFVYVSVFPEKYQKRVMAGLSHATRHVQTELREKVDMRIVPRIEFRYDEQLAKQNQVLGAVSEAMRRTGEAPPDDATEPGVDPADEGERGPAADPPPRRGR